MTVCRCGNTIHRSNRGMFCDLCSESARIPERQYAIFDATMEGRDGLVLDDTEVSVYRDPETNRITVQVRSRENAADLDEDGGPICDIVKIPRERIPEPAHIISGTAVGGFTTLVGSTGVEWANGGETIIYRAETDPREIRMRDPIGSFIRVARRENEI